MSDWLLVWFLVGFLVGTVMVVVCWELWFWLQDRQWTRRYRACVARVVSESWPRLDFDATSGLIVARPVTADRIRSFDVRRVDGQPAACNCGDALLTARSASSTGGGVETLPGRPPVSPSTSKIYERKQ